MTHFQVSDHIPYSQGHSSLLQQRCRVWHSGCNGAAAAVRLHYFPDILRDPLGFCREQIGESNEGQLGAISPASFSSLRATLISVLLLDMLLFVVITWLRWG